MTPEKEVLLNQHIEAIAALLYDETEPEKVESLEKIESTIRKQTLEYITPKLGVFLSNRVQELHQEEEEK